MTTHSDIGHRFGDDVWRGLGGAYDNLSVTFHDYLFPHKIAKSYYTPIGWHTLELPECLNDLPLVSPCVKYAGAQDISISTNRHYSHLYGGKATWGHLHFTDERRGAHPYSDRFFPIAIHHMKGKIYHQAYSHDRIDDPVYAELQSIQGGYDLDDILLQGIFGVYPRAIPEIASPTSTYARLDERVETAGMTLRFHQNELSIWEGFEIYKQVLTLSPLELWLRMRLLESKTLITRKHSHSHTFVFYDPDAIRTDSTLYAGKGLFMQEYDPKLERFYHEAKSNNCFARVAKANTYKTPKNTWLFKNRVRTGFGHEIDFRGTEFEDRWFFFFHPVRKDVESLTTFRKEHSGKNPIGTQFVVHEYPGVYYPCARLGPDYHLPGLIKDQWSLLL